MNSRSKNDGGMWETRVVKSEGSENGGSTKFGKFAVILDRKSRLLVSNFSLVYIPTRCVWYFIHVSMSAIVECVSEHICSSYSILCASNSSSRRSLADLWKNEISYVTLRIFCLVRMKISKPWTPRRWVLRWETLKSAIHPMNWKYSHAFAQLCNKKL